jgi:hypothetical protein
MTQLFQVNITKILNSFHVFLVFTNYKFSSLLHKYLLKGIAGKKEDNGENELLNNIAACSCWVFFFEMSFNDLDERE